MVEDLLSKKEYPTFENHNELINNSGSKLIFCPSDFLLIMASEISIRVFQ